MSGDGSYTDYDMGAVISADGEVSYVDTDLGIIMGPDGDVSSHDAKSGMTYNWSTGQMLCPFLNTAAITSRLSARTPHIS